MLNNPLYCNACNPSAVRAQVWSCSARSVAPLGVRWCVSRHARALAGGGQHDAQELLAWLLDALHEDLNRARPPAPAPAPADSAGRPDQVVAAEAWEAHTARNQSIITELFYGQLKSKVRCDTCGHESVRFDAFNMLSLPLPMESYLRCEIKVILLDGSVPVKYGVRVNSEGTYLDLKRKLSELCGLPPDLLLLAELAGATIGRELRDADKLTAAGAADLYAYELPPPREPPAARDLLQPDGWCEEASQWAEVSVGRAANPSSLCMPALFCFKRSRSEMLMSQSPPTTFYEKQHHQDRLRSQTLPKDMTRGNSSPALSVKSLNVKPASPRLAKVKFGSSPSNMYKMSETESPSLVPKQTNYLVAVHRKQCRADAYFLSSQRSRPALFGVPLLVPVEPGQSGRQLYAAVWRQVARLLSARPPSADLNHATDCDDSLGYEFPFTLRAVRADGAWCGRCAWPALCRGCALPLDDRPLVAHADGTIPVLKKRSGEEPPDEEPGPAGRPRQPPGARSASRPDGGCWLRAGSGRVLLAVDWEPTALHLRYSSALERACAEHGSVRAGGARPAGLASCLRAFTRAERLEQHYRCARCRSHQPATKTLQIWRLPPILIIHLKRFQYVNDKWIKSQKVVNFPYRDFDPTEFLAAVPQETILRHAEINYVFTSRPSQLLHDAASGSDGEDDSDTDADGPEQTGCARRRSRSPDSAARRRLQSTSLASTPVTADNLQDFHRHLLQDDQDPLDLKYSLYAVVSHSGQMSGGHYVAYARNPSGTWLCYNDSMCRALPPSAEPPIDPATAYLLFYERQGLDYDRYLPDVGDRRPAAGLLDPDDSDLRKMCVLG